MALKAKDTLAERLLAGDEKVLGEMLSAFGLAIREGVARKYKGLLQPDEIDETLLITSRAGLATARTV